MSGNSTVSLTLQIKGQQAASEMKRISDQQIQATTKINTQWTQIGSAQAKFVNTARAGTRETINTARAGDQLLRTNRMLEGVLRQQSIQTKLQSQLLKQQVGSAQQLANWAKQVEQSSKRTHQSTQQTVSLWQKGTALGGGAIAGGAVLSNAMQKPRDYDQQLTYIAATATGGKGMSPTARLAARSQLNEYIKAAVRGGGGTREDAAEAANALIASGKYELNNVAPALNTATKTAFATGATATDAAALTVRMQDFGITDLQRGHDIAVRGGQLGSFEYKDQAKWLAQQMAAARAVGYSGEKGFVELVAMNQVAMKTAGTTDEAGNNVVNLLAKLSSAEFSKSIADAVKVQAGDPTKSNGKKKASQVFDWSTYAIQQRDQGVYGVEAFVKLLERQLSGNAQYKKLQSQAKSSDSATRSAALNDMSNIAMGSEIGNIIADRQALMAALSVVYNKDTLKDLRTQLPNASGTVAADSAMVRQTEWAKDQAMNQEKLFAQSKAYDAVSESLGNAKEKITDWASNNEKLAASAYAASIALGAVAVGAGAATILGGKGGVAGKAGTAVASRAIPYLQKAAVPLTVAAGAYNLYDTATDETLTKAQKQTQSSAIVGGTGGAVAGGYAGAAIGSAIFPGIGTAVGGIIGGGLGYLLGEKGGQELGEYFSEQTSISGEQKTLMEQHAQQNERIIQGLQDVKNAVANNKPIFGGGSLLDAISHNAAVEEKRHGAPNVPF
ncbi:phage tail tape measure protein [Acinetobacter pittii]